MIRTLNTLCAGLAVLGLVPALTGCDTLPQPARFDLVIGSHGYTSGKFHRPRGIAHDPATDMLFVVDWSGRIQKFTTDGALRASWIMPDIAKGKPEDLCVTSNGTLLVTDTHYSRIMEFSADGRRLREFGRYGRGPGEFIYPVGICTDPEGHIYVSEYGENDRIQKFAADGRFIAVWGSMGTAEGQFQRPSGIALSTNGLLYVADAVNHRLQVFDTAGRFIRIIGREGAEPGQFRYPYDVAVRGENLYVLEFGNQRAQRLTLEGQPLGQVGRPGRGDGGFACPWRFAFAGDRLYVSDTDNSRVVRLGVGF